MKGLGKVELGDIVVFNYPAGDTVAVDHNGDYYDLCFQLGLNAAQEQGYNIPLMQTMSTADQLATFNLPAERTLICTLDRMGNLYAQDYTGASYKKRALTKEQAKV